jgi:hypothetical protein
MRKKTFISVILLCAFPFIVSAQSVQDSRKLEEYNKWIIESIQEMKTIEVGQSRADLLKVFTYESGMSIGLNRRFVYRKCPFIKVDVQFEAFGRTRRDAEGRERLVADDRDKIISISKPYLE